MKLLVEVIQHAWCKTLKREALLPLSFLLLSGNASPVSSNHPKNRTGHKSCLPSHSCCPRKSKFIKTRSSACPTLRVGLTVGLLIFLYTSLTISTSLSLSRNPEYTAHLLFSFPQFKTKSAQIKEWETVVKSSGVEEQDPLLRRSHESTDGVKRAQDFYTRLRDQVKKKVQLVVFVY